MKKEKEVWTHTHHDQMMKPAGVDWIQCKSCKVVRKKLSVTGHKRCWSCEKHGLYSGA